MTVSTTSIPVLHSAEFAHLYPQVMLPICQGIATSHTPLPRRRGRVTLRGLYKVPLASENPLQFIGSSNAGIPCLTAIAANVGNTPREKQSSPGGVLAGERPTPHSATQTDHMRAQYDYRIKANLGMQLTRLEIW
jgi:hypothetical protein